MTASATRTARCSLSCTGLLVAAGLLASASGAIGAGGLQVDPLRIQASPRPGIIGRIDVGNPSNERITVTVTPRRWRQSATGKLGPDMRSGGEVRALAVDARSFTLAPGQHRLVATSLPRVPANGYLYATVVTYGVSAGRRAGLQPAYRIVTAVHLEPSVAKRRVSLAVAPPRVVTQGRRTVAFEVAARNLGNMVDPVGGTVTVRGRGSVRVARIKPVPILPRATVRLTAGGVRALRPGRYRATVRVSQRGHERATSTVRFRVTRGGRLVRRAA